MIKVILECENRDVKLIPEHTPVREVLEQFRVDTEDKVLSVNSRILDDDDLDETLVKFSNHDEVRITSVPKAIGEAAESPNGGAIVLSGSEGKAYLALAGAKEAIEKAMRSLGSPATKDDEELPF